MTGKYKRKDGTLFDVILTKKKGREYFERSNCKDFGYRQFSRVTEEEIKKELESGEIEKIYDESRD